jgi:predicted phage-related endonuclease
VKFTILDCAQRSPEWFAARAGRVTGSRADAVIAKGRGNEEATKRRDLRILLAQERVAGIAMDTDGYVSAEMQRGTDLEPAARAAYDAHEGLFNSVRVTGFLSADDLMIGASLDGDLDDFRIVVSFKCPKSANHYEYARLAEGELPKAYIGQISHELLITGAQEYHFVSFDDRFRGRAESLQLVIKRYRREQVDLKSYEKELMKFLAEVDRETDTVLTMANPSAQMEASLA